MTDARSSGSNGVVVHRETWTERRSSVQNNALAYSLFLSSWFLRGLFFIMLALSAFMSLIYPLLPFSPCFPSHLPVF